MPSVSEIDRNIVEWQRLRSTLGNAPSLLQMIDNEIAKLRRQRRAIGSPPVAGGRRATDPRPH
jgi:hypothetical protein